MFAELSNPWWVFVILGLFAGIVSGLLGIGSGTVVVPALVIIAGATQKTAQGTALAAMVPMALLGAMRYWRSPEIEISLPVIILIVIGSLGGVLLGTELAIRLPAHVLRKIFATFLVLVAVKMFTTSNGSKQAESGSPPTRAVDGSDNNTEYRPSRDRPPLK